MKDSLFEIADDGNRVPELEMPFLIDQRGPRVMEIGDMDDEENSKVDAKEAKKECLRRKKVKQLEKERIWSETRNATRFSTGLDNGKEAENLEEEDDDEDVDYNCRVVRNTRGFGEEENG